jgi:oligosaccharide repeat unit polymerase
VIVVGYQLIILNRGPAIYHLIAYLVGVFSLIIAQKGLGHALSKILVTSIIIVVFFGFLGNLRSADVQIIKDIFGVNPEYYWLPDALLWVLIYFTSPFSNLLYNISLDDVSCTSGMLSTLSGMVPGFLRNDLLQHDVDTGFNLPCETTGNLYYPGLNVSTGFVQFFIDYGLVGFLMFSVLTSFVFRRLSKNGMENWDAFSSLFCVLLFVNIFAPSFTQLSFVISFLILMLFSRRICAA